jgi:hypothetical protein
VWTGQLQQKKQKRSIFQCLCCTVELATTNIRSTTKILNFVLCQDARGLRFYKENAENPGGTTGTQYRIPQRKTGDEGWALSFILPWQSLDIVAQNLCCRNLLRLCVLI